MPDGDKEKTKGNDKKKEADADEKDFQTELAASGKKDEGVKDLSEIVESEYNSAALHYKRAGDAYAKAGDHASAASMYDAAGDMYEAAAKINIAMGESPEAKKRLQKALEMFGKSVKEYGLDHDTNGKKDEEKKAKDFKETTYKDYKLK